MATWTVACPGRMRMRFLLWLLASAFSMVSADVAMATTYSMAKVLDWQKQSVMQLAITGQDGVSVPLTYSVIPLTASLGLNESDVVRGTISIRGTMVATDSSNYVTVMDTLGAETVAYLCCDSANNSFITPSSVLNSLMNSNPQPKAILLYSLQGSCCGISGQDLPYQTIFTMADQGEAASALNNTDNADGTIQATITGNVTSSDQDSQDNQTGSNSAVAMSILYSITGLITLLFLVIIATGAIRAHRYPERYGPRSGYGGRPRQSRARGLARAVLETIPIVKFGNPDQAKPDPANYELESASVEHQQANRSAHHLSTIPEDPPETPKQNAENTRPSETTPDASLAPVASGAAGTGSGDDQSEEHLGCSICTEDFHVGEDVRVLPCNHKFHPQCIDPWLVNVSGTCPLCRLDLRPEEDKDAAEQGAPLAPPLEADGVEEGTASHRRRSRLFDLHRLRHASVEERIEVLRRYRTEHQDRPAENENTVPEHEGESDERSRRARLTDRLRDRFRIRTRAQSPERTESSTGPGDGPSPA
ncbi:Ring finger domain protein [Pleurostoma richardsiae]|uniref:RING-type E3 ubiquitin transferase n=1 Tax=Pleurostoma richardsiae TaxID=41990 RepID=A0AA38RT01_9PEZI|nr:Ring finger domain protein [Pleurostoma richardsiae]